MMRCAPLAVLLALLASTPAWADRDPETAKITAKYKKNVDRGLQYLAKAQFRDGHWEATGGTYPIAMTALAGMALMAEGSTPHQGKYCKEIDNAVEFLMSRSQKNGLIGNPNDQREQQQYMYGHGFATMFLSQAYGEMNDERRRKKLEDILTRACHYSGEAQTNLGGWGYVSAKDSGDFDEGSVTITQVQALRAARDAGIPVAQKIIVGAYDYLKKSTMISTPNEDKKKEEGGVIYSLRHGRGNVRPALTAAGIACVFSAGEYESEYAVKWLNYCARQFGVNGTGGGAGIGHWEYTHLYFSQVMFVLGEDRHAKLRPDLGEIERSDPSKKVLLKWSRYREAAYEQIASRQSSDGSWATGHPGPVYTTALNLIILQLDNAALPIYQR